MEAYNILNTIKPKFLISKFPYNLVNPEKIILTRKKISIMVKRLKQVEGGRVKEDLRIVLYG
jgi:hypothetical protein